MKMYNIFIFTGKRKKQLAMTNARLFLIATKMNAMLIITIKKGKQLAITNANFLSRCCED